MLNLAKITDIDVSGKRVLVRADLDLPAGRQVFLNDTYRLEALIPTLEHLFERNCEIILMGHRGHPSHKAPDGIDEDLSLKPVGEALEGLLKEKWGEEKVAKLRMNMMENLRFDPGEEENDPNYAQHLAENGDFFVNEAFASSHREHASIVSVPKILPHAAGLRFIKEVENLSKLFENPKRPVVVVIGGIKEDKAMAIEGLAGFADKILVGGRLPLFFGDNDTTSVSLVGDDEKAIYANLIPDKEDITLSTVERFEKEIAKAGTIWDQWANLRMKAIGRGQKESLRQ
jgi:phosphoglycerate kinase